MTGETIAGICASSTEEHIELQIWISSGSHIFICLIYVEVSFILVIIIPCVARVRRRGENMHSQNVILCGKYVETKNSYLLLVEKIE